MFDHPESGIELSDQESKRGEVENLDEFFIGSRSRRCRKTGQTSHVKFCPRLSAGYHLEAQAVIALRTDRKKLNGHDLVTQMEVDSGLGAAFEGRKLESIAELAHTPSGGRDADVCRVDVPDVYTALDVAAALNMTRRASEDQLADALCLHDQLSRVGEALRLGAIDVQRARVFIRQLGYLSSETIEAVLDRTIDKAADLTTGQLRARLHRIVLELDPEGLELGNEWAKEERKIVATQNPDQTSGISILGGDPASAAAAMRYINKLARRIKTKTEKRTLDQIRHDIAIDLLNGKHIHGESGVGSVDLVITFETLVGLSDAPADLPGFGPLLAEMARKTALANRDGEWRFTVVDNGQPLATGTLARRPTAAMQRHLHALYPTCQAIGCRMPARYCDIDHINPHARGGRTNLKNLIPLGRHHHMAKHATRWKVERVADGRIKWTSPHAHTYIKERDPPD